MASRAEQKAALRAAREAQQKQVSAAQMRRKRLYGLGAVLAGAVVALVIVIVAGSGGTPASAPIKPQVAKASVAALLKGIPQSGNTIGAASAPVTITEYGDLVCPICKEFATGSGRQLIANNIRAGQVKLVYRGLETASSTANGGEYVASQVAARAAGLQGRAWQYILLWYDEQPSETTPYVTDAFMQGIAAQIPGLNLTKWSTDRNSAALANAVSADTRAAAAEGLDNPPQTPSFTFVGPKGAAQPLVGLPTYAGLQAEIQAVG